MPKSAEAQPSKASARAADIGVLRLIAELFGAADDDGIHAKKFPDLGGGRRIGAIAVRKILFGQNLVQRFAFDDGIRAVLNEMFTSKSAMPLPTSTFVPKTAAEAVWTVA
jgi:hypothetical protein